MGLGFRVQSLELISYILIKSLQKPLEYFSKPYGPPVLGTPRTGHRGL